MFSLCFLLAQVPPVYYSSFQRVRRNNELPPPSISSFRGRECLPVISGKAGVETTRAVRPLHLTGQLAKTESRAATGVAAGAYAVSDGGHARGAGPTDRAPPRLTPLPGLKGALQRVRFRPRPKVPPSLQRPLSADCVCQLGPPVRPPVGGAVTPLAPKSGADRVFQLLHTSLSICVSAVRAARNRKQGPSPLLPRERLSLCACGAFGFYPVEQCGSRQFTNAGAGIGLIRAMASLVDAGDIIFFIFLFPFFYV